jgi:hypothetical protein
MANLSELLGHGFSFDMLWNQFLIKNQAITILRKMHHLNQI